MPLLSELSCLLLGKVLLWELYAELPKHHIWKLASLLRALGFSYNLLLQRFWHILECFLTCFRQWLWWHHRLWQLCFAFVMSSPLRHRLWRLQIVRFVKCVEEKMYGILGLIVVVLMSTIPRLFYIIYAFDYNLCFSVKLTWRYLCKTPWTLCPSLLTV